jgi:hypothetical protein
MMATHVVISDCHRFSQTAWVVGVGRPSMGMGPIFLTWEEPIPGHGWAWVPVNEASTPLLIMQHLPI